jgi:predicted acyltransferase
MILVNNPGSWTAVYEQLEHSEWNGWTFTDLVFPFFLWIAGAAIVFSRPTHARAFRRAVLIFVVALLLNAFPYFTFHFVRIPGVLQRIAVCYLIATLIFLHAKVRGIVIWIVGLLAGYWIMMLLYPAADHFGKEDNLARYVDSLVLAGHMWTQTKTWDPEGIVSTIPAIATALFGVLTGIFLRSGIGDKVARMFVAANLLLLWGLVMNIWIPINKNLWTSSYSVFMAGLALNVFACFYWIIDVQGRRAWARPFVIYGMNALAAYVLSGAIARLAGIWHLQEACYRVLAEFASPKNASLLYAVGNVVVVYVFCWVLYRRKWFLRL